MISFESTERPIDPDRQRPLQLEQYRTAPRICRSLCGGLSVRQAERKGRRLLVCHPGRGRRKTAGEEVPTIDMRRRELTTRRGGYLAARSARGGAARRLWVDVKISRFTNR